MTPAEVAGRQHPRLFLLTVVGVIGLLLGGLVALLPLADSGRTVWALRFGFVGFLLLVAGLAGYVAIGVFERQPGP